MIREGEVVGELIQFGRMFLRDKQAVASIELEPVQQEVPRVQLGDEVARAIAYLELSDTLTKGAVFHGARLPQYEG